MNDFILALKNLIDYIYEPFIDVVNQVFDTSLINITPGFGSITWFTIALDDLLYFIIAFITYYIIIKLVIKFILIPFQLLRSLF